MVQNVDKRDLWGNTPLHYAALSPSEELFSALLAQGADREALNLMGATPFDIKKLIQKKVIGEVAGYPLLGEVYANPSDLYLWWTEVKPGEKWTFFNMYPSYAGVKKRGDCLVVQGNSAVGRRVFAKEKIEEGAMLCEYLGEFYPAVFYTQEMQGLFEVPPGLFKKAKRGESDYINGCINGREHGNEAALISDGVPNVEFVPSPCTGGLPLRMMVRALTEIQKGEEVTAYYMGHPLRYDPGYIELCKERRMERTQAILEGRVGVPEEWFLRYLFHTPYLLLPLLLQGEINWKTYKVLFHALPEEVTWITLTNESVWPEYVSWMGNALKGLSGISFPHTRLFFEALTEMSCTFERRGF